MGLIIDIQVPHHDFSIKEIQKWGNHAGICCILEV